VSELPIGRKPRIVPIIDMVPYDPVPSLVGAFPVSPCLHIAVVGQQVVPDVPIAGDPGTDMPQGFFHCSLPSHFFVFWVSTIHGPKGQGHQNAVDREYAFHCCASFLIIAILLSRKSWASCPRRRCTGGFSSWPMLINASAAFSGSLGWFPLMSSLCAR